MLTIIPDDNTVIVDGKIARMDLSLLRIQGIHAVQWNGIEGNIERKGRDAVAFNQVMFLVEYKHIADIADRAVEIINTPIPEPEITPEMRRLIRMKEIENDFVRAMLLNDLPLQNQLRAEYTGLAAQSSPAIDKEG